MIDKKSIIKMAEHVFKRSQGYPDRRLMHPRREWQIGIVLFVFLVVAGGIFAGKVFVQYTNTNDVQGVLEKSVPQYREAIVKDALELYRQRAVQFDFLKELYAVPNPVIFEDTSQTEQQVDTLQTVPVIAPQSDGIPLTAE